MLSYQAKATAMHGLRCFDPQLEIASAMILGEFFLVAQWKFATEALIGNHSGADVGKVEPAFGNSNMLQIPSVRKGDAFIDNLAPAIDVFTKWII